MVLILYGYRRSTYTRLVALICKEKEIPYELVPVDLVKQEHKTAEFIRHHPFSQVPYIDDDGFILYESRAIARYLIKKYPNQGTPDLIPTGLKEEALFEQAASIEAFNFDSTAGPFIQVLKLAHDAPIDTTKADESLAKLEAKLDVYDDILGKQRYLAGDNLTLADLQHLARGTTLFFRGYGHVIENRPNVARWWKEIYNRPTWQAVKDGA